MLFCRARAKTNCLFDVGGGTSTRGTLGEEVYSPSPPLSLFGAQVNICDHVIIGQIPSIGKIGRIVEVTKKLTVRLITNFSYNIPSNQCQFERAKSR